MAEVLHYERNYTDACAWYAKALQIKPGLLTIMIYFVLVLADLFIYSFVCLFVLILSFIISQLFLLQILSPLGDSALIRAFSQAQQEGVLDKARRDAQPPKEEGFFFFSFFFSLLKFSFLTLIFLLSPPFSSSPQRKRMKRRKTKRKNNHFE